MHVKEVLEAAHKVTDCACGPARQLEDSFDPGNHFVAVGWRLEDIRGGEEVALHVAGGVGKVP